jgi:hypothetical protein
MQAAGASPTLSPIYQILQLHISEEGVFNLNYSAIIYDFINSARYFCSSAKENLTTHC